MFVQKAHRFKNIGKSVTAIDIFAIYEFTL